MASSMPTAMPGSMNCSSAVGLSRPAAGRMCGANSSTFMPPPAPPSPKRRSIALASSTPSRRPSMDYRPSGDNSSASSSQSRLPRHWPPGPTTRCASSPANPSSPLPSAICGRAGRRWCAASTMAVWRSTTIPLSALCAALRRGVHYAPLLQVSVNIASWFSRLMRDGRPFRPNAAVTRWSSKSQARIWYGAPGTTCSAGRTRSLIKRRIL